MGRRWTTRIGLGMLALAIGLPAVAQASVGVLWRYDAGRQKTRRLHNHAEIVADRAAPGGKAMRLPFAEGRFVLPGIGANGLVLAGPVAIAAYVRAEGLTGISETWRLHAYLREQKSGRTHEAVTLVQPVRVPANAYVALPFRIEIPKLPPEPKTYSLYMMRECRSKTGKARPVVWIASVELTGHGKAAPYISEVEPDKTAYRPAQPIKTRITVVNPTKRPFAGTLVLEERCGLESTREAGKRSVSVAAGKTASVDFRWQATTPEAGRELHVELRGEAGPAIDTSTTYYGIANDPSFLATTPRYSAETGHRGYHHVFYVGPGSLARSTWSVLYCKSRYTQRYERFSWSYNELAQFLPPKDEEPYLGNEGIWWQSFKKQKTQLHMLKGLGITTITYINGHLWGPAAYDLYQKHPEWFVYTKAGELQGNSYDMENRANYMRRNEFEFVQSKTPFFYGNLIPTLPECRRYIADQIISTARELGFEGVRWDVWSMEVKPGQYAIDGKPLAGSWKEADRQTAESMAALKAMVAKEIPNFTWGYNYASPAENTNTPLTLREKCRGGGWMLDEVICAYQEKTSPFHYWHTYRDRIVGWGDRIRKLGGIYNPFAFRRGGGRYAVDRLYEGIFRLIGSGRSDNIYENDAGRVGRIGLMALRFSNIFLGWNLDLKAKDQKLIRVQAPDTLWWRQMVLSNKSLTGRPQAIVHLVNSPLAKEVEENPESKVRAPVLGVTVSCEARGGKLPRKAWIVTAEPLRPDGEPKVQAVPLQLVREKETASVTVPSVLYWKTVVFEF